MKRKNITLLLVLLIMMPSFVSAESSIFSLVPGSLGEHHYPYSTAALGRGGFSMAFADSVTLNHMNYAMWSFISRTTFSISASYQGLMSESESSEINSLDGNFLGGYLAIPIIRKKVVLGFGILPKSINNQGFLIKNVGVGATADQTLKTKGTLSEVELIASYAPTENLAIGLATYYVFGKITDQTRIDYTDRSYKDINITNQYEFYGKGPSLGISAFYRVNTRLAVGTRIKLPTTLEVYSEQTSIATEKTTEKFRDVTIPYNWTIGITYQPHERWVIGADFDHMNWQDGYLLDGTSFGQLTDNFRFGAGIERLPSARRMAAYGDKMNYRAGIFYGKMNFLANGESVNDYGISIGLGLPISGGTSRLDMALQFGKRGRLSINGLSETFFRVNFSLAANELWFVREER